MSMKFVVFESLDKSLPLRKPPLYLVESRRRAMHARGGGPDLPLLHATRNGLVA
jgi:hypothetical protein